MAKDDYFALVWRILSYLYACMKAGDPCRLEEISAETLRINCRYWTNIIYCLAEQGYLTGAADLCGEFIIGELKITHSGIEYLYESPMMQKAAEVWRDRADACGGLVSKLT